MAVNVDEGIRKLRPAQRRKVEARAAELVAEEMTLRELRKARRLTQVRVAKSLGITQDSVSRLEQRSDLLLSTLRKSVAALGGRLSLVVEFPDRAPVVLAGIAEAGPVQRSRGRKAASRSHTTGRGRRKASVEELLSIADRTAASIRRPYEDHGTLLYDEDGLPK